MKSFLLIFFVLFILKTQASFSDVALADFQNDPEGQQALYFGSQWIVSQLLGYGIIPGGSTYNVSQVISVSEESSNGNNYAINAIISNGAGNSFTALYVVNTDSSQNKIDVAYTSYDLDNGAGTSIGLPTTEIATLIEEEPPVLEEASAGGDVSTPSETQGWTDVDVSMAQSDSTVSQLFNQGETYAIMNAQNTGALYTASWTVFSMDQIASQSGSSGTTYRFTVTFSDGTFMRAHCEYFVLQDPTGGSHVISAGFWSIVPGTA